MLLFVCLFFFQMFSIQEVYIILDTKSLRFLFCRSFFWPQNWLKKSQANSGRLISSLHPVSLQEPDLHLENSRREQHVLDKLKVNMINRYNIENSSNMLSLTTILAVSQRSQTVKANCSTKFVFCSMFTIDKRCFSNLLLLPIRCYH